MSLLLLLLLLTPSPSISEIPSICMELAVILEDAVGGGYINEQEAADVLSRCAVGGDFD